MRSFLYLFLGLYFVGLIAPGSELSGQEPEPFTEVAYDLDWRPDGSVLMVAASNHLWLLDSQFQLVGAYPYPPALNEIPPTPWAVEWSPDGSWIAAIFDDGGCVSGHTRQVI